MTNPFVLFVPASLLVKRCSIRDVAAKCGFIEAYWAVGRLGLPIGRTGC